MRQPVILRNRLEIGVLEADGRGGMSQERPQPPDLSVAFYSLLHCRRQGGDACGAADLPFFLKKRGFADKQNSSLRAILGDEARPGDGIETMKGGRCPRIFGDAAVMPAKIYRPAKTAMQSGKAKTHLWVLEFDQESPRKIDPIMGYTSSGDMRQQVKLTFETQALAEAYAQRNGIEYRVIAPKEPARQVVAYPDNFRYTRTQPWTH
ncbi:UNVERIFIED_ORG: hypothetical protein M2312_002608 [Rhizobium esperanzae]|nr:hypothetical protein [Rhizobium esperanzae]